MGVLLLALTFGVSAVVCIAQREVVLGNKGQLLKIAITEIDQLFEKFSDVMGVEDIAIIGPKGHKETRLVAPDALQLRSSIITNAGPLNLLWPKQSRTDRGGCFFGCYWIDDVKNGWPGAIQRNDQILGRRISAIFDGNGEAANNLISSLFRRLPIELIDSRENEGSFARSQGLIGFIKSAPLEAANNYQQKGTNSEYRGDEGDRLFEFSSPTIGQFIFFLGFLIGLSSIPFIFSRHCWLTPIGILVGGLLIILGSYLTPLDRRSENVRIHTVIIAELKFRDIERHIFGAHLVERADHAAFEDRPESFNRVGMDRADHILLAVVIDRLVIVSGQSVINFAFVGGEQANFVRHHFANESLSGFAGNAVENAGDDVTLPADSANDRSFGGRTMLAASDFAVPMLILVLPANEAFIHFDDTAKLLDVLDQRGSDLMAHQPSGFIGTEALVAHDLEGAQALFAGEHEVSDLEPVAERLVGVLEDRPGNMTEPIAVRGALFALPVPPARPQVIDLGIAAPGTMHTIGPPTGNQIGFAGFFVREGRVELSGGHLRDGFGTFCHGSTPWIEPYSHNSRLLSSPGYSPTLKVTPAMAAGVTSKLWEMADMV